MYTISTIPPPSRRDIPPSFSGVVPSIQGKVQACLHPDMKDFFSLISDMDDKKSRKYLKGASPESIQNNFQTAYRLLLENWTVCYGDSYTPYEEGVKHFLGNITQRITYHLNEGEQGRIKILRILRLFSLLYSCDHVDKLTPIFYVSKARFSREDYQVDPWFLSCEKYFGI